MRILRKWARHRHPELPIIQHAPVMNDADVDFHSDILYFRGLLDSIAHSSDLETRLQLFDPAMSTKLDVALDLLRNPIFDWTIPAQLWAAA